MAKRSNGEGTIFKRSDGRWCGAYYDDEFKRHYVYAKTQKEVKAKLQEKMQHSNADMAKISLQDWILQYLDKYKKNELKITTYETYRSIWQKHIEGSPLGLKKLSDITSNMLQNYYNSKDNEGYNPKTIKHISVIINGAFDKAYKLRMIPENPNSFTTTPKKKRYEASVLSKDDVLKLVEESKEEPLYPIVITTIFTGMRKGEVMGLKWKNVDFENKVIHVEGSLSKIVSDPDEKGHRHASYVITEPKTLKSRRTIPLTDISLEALLIQKTRQDKDKLKNAEIYDDNDLVFCNPYGGYIAQRPFMNEFHDYLRKYNVTDVRFHDLRHSFASLLLESGVSIKVIQECLGHSSISMSMDTYTHISDNLKKQSLSELDSIIRENKDKAD